MALRFETEAKGNDKIRNPWTRNGGLVDADELEIKGQMLWAQMTIVSHELKWPSYLMSSSLEKFVAQLRLRHKNTPIYIACTLL